MTAGEQVEEIADVIRRHRFRYADEAMLQEGLAAALEEAGVTVEREVRLDAHCRIDLMIGRVGVEVKVNGTLAQVRRQVERYLKSDLLDGLVLVSGRARHVGLHGDFSGKPVRVVTLLGANL